MSERPSVERRLIQLLTVIAAIAIAGVLAILPYRLYERDTRLAQVNAHRMASLLHASLAHELQHGTSSADVADLVNRLQAVADLQIHLRELQPGEVHPAASEGRGSSRLEGTALDYTAAPILDREGHTWLAQMHFDLAAIKRDSVRLIIDLMLAVALGSAAFSLAVFLLVRRTLVQPLREVTQRVERFAAGEEGGALPQFESRELDSLMQALDRARHVRLRPS
jgi:methyl-accepting chemotaxis protein